MSSAANTLTTAHHEWDRRWADDTSRADWLTPQPSVLQVLQQVQERQADSSPLRVVDVGCGVGRHALAYAQAGCLVIACDGSPQGLQFAAETAEQAKILGISWHQCPFTSIPAEDHSCDLVLAWNVIYHGTHDDIANAFREMERVLKVGGIIHCTLLSKRNSGFGVGTEVAPDTWINHSNPEKAHAHSYTSAADVVRLLGPNLELMSLMDNEHKYPGSKSWHWELVAEKCN